MDRIGVYLADQITPEMLSRRFRVRRWPVVPPACPPGLEAAPPAIDYPEPHVSGASRDMVRAYAIHVLQTREITG